MFKIKDINFNVKYAYLDAFINEDEKLLKFGLQIKAEGNENFFDGEEPHFNSELLLKIRPNKIKKWQDISGKIIKWKNYSDDENSPKAFLYIFENEAVYNANIEFRNKDGKIIIKINSFCDINYDDEYSDNLPLEIETEINFYGILCGKDTTEDECKNKIKSYLDIENFKHIKNKYGVSLMIPKDSNMETNLLVLGEY